MHRSFEKKKKSFLFSSNEDDEKVEFPSNGIVRCKFICRTLEISHEPINYNVFKPHRYSSKDDYTHTCIANYYDHIWHHYKLNWTPCTRGRI